MVKTFQECLDDCAIANGWKDFDDIVFNSNQRRTIEVSMTTGFKNYISQISEIISYDDKDEDEKLQEIKKLIDKEF